MLHLRDGKNLRNETLISYSQLTNILLSYLLPPQTPDSIYSSALEVCKLLGVYNKICELSGPELYFVSCI